MSTTAVRPFHRDEPSWPDEPASLFGCREVELVKVGVSLQHELDAADPLRLVDIAMDRARASGTSGARHVVRMLLEGQVHGGIVQGAGPAIGAATAPTSGPRRKARQWT